MTLPPNTPRPDAPDVPPVLGEVGPSIGDVDAVLARLEAWSLSDWIRLAQHPALYKGWDRDHHARSPLIQAAGRLAARDTASRIEEMPPSERRTALTTPQDLAGFSGPVRPLTVVLGAHPQRHPTPTLPMWPWRPEQRAAQEVIVGLLLAAGAQPVADDWRYAASVLLRNHHGDAEDTNPRLLRRLLAQHDPWDPAVLGDAPSPLLATMAQRRDPWPEDLLRTVIERCPDLDAPCADGASALNWAAGFGQGFGQESALRPGPSSVAPIALVRALLDAGADPQQAGPDGYKAVHRWARNDAAPEVLDLLLAHGARLDSVQFDRREGPALTLAADARHPDAASTVANGLMPIHIAAMSYSPRALDRLLALGVDPEVPDLMTGNTPLHWAVLTRCAASVERLLATPITLDRRNARGLTPVQMLDLRGGSWHAADPEATVLRLIEDRLLRHALHHTLLENGEPQTADPLVDRSRPRPRL